MNNLLEALSRTGIKWDQAKQAWKLSEAGMSGAKAGKALQRLMREDWKMDDKTKMMVGDNWAAMYSSLVDAVKEAGGHLSSFTWERVRDMTVAELFNSLATNHIRFICIDKEDKDDPKC